MKTINLGQKNSIFNHFVSELRNVKIQSDSMRFRRNLERIGEIFAYEISKGFSYDTNKITIFEREGKEFRFENKSKSEVAKDIIDTIIKLYYA